MSVGVRHTEEETPRIKRPFAYQLRSSLIDKSSITCMYVFCKLFLVKLYTRIHACRNHF
nr:MAG TPA: hypothetical protein [Caudoviricetes sp.]